MAAVLTAIDIPGKNQIGAIVADETLLADGHVHFVGEPIAIVAADTQEHALAARDKIVLEIDEHLPVLTVSHALANQQFVGPVRRIERGSVDEVFARTPNIIEGVVRNGGQEHFYLETQCALAIPGEGGSLTIFSSTQNPNEVHRMAAGVLGLRQHDIVVDVKRLGGGFGGKEAQATAWACLAALAAHHTGRAAQVRLEREEDMLFTGKRHAFESVYKAAFDHEGRILAYQVELQSNCGAVADVSTSVLERAMLHADNAYYIENMRVIGRPCRTNIHPATAFRGFGAPQGVLVIEAVLERIAHRLGLDSYTVKQRNLYRKGDTAHYGEGIADAEHMGAIIAKLRRDSRWDERREAVRDFNRGSKFAKQGLALVPIKFGISFTAAHLNQGCALVHIYHDGSVSVTHGAIEMGQEVNTKIAQVAAANLGVPLHFIRIDSNNTGRVANAPPTAASSGCDLNGAAVDDATRRLAQRLAGFAAAVFEGPVHFADGNVFAATRQRAGESCEANAPLCSFVELIHKAIMHRIDLTEHGHYATPGIHFNRDTGQGTPFLYYVFGAAVAQVTVDLLTGACTTDYVRILHDSGKSLNPAVDIGQIQGAFVQGMGWCTTEELVYGGSGKLLSNSPQLTRYPRSVMCRRSLWSSCMTRVVTMWGCIARRQMASRLSFMARRYSLPSPTPWPPRGCTPRRCRYRQRPSTFSRTLSVCPCRLLRRA